MNEEEKKTIEKFIEKCYKYDESVEIKGISVGEEYRMLNTVCKALNLIEKLQKENEELKSENRRLKVIRYSTEYGTENIHLITKSDLVEINTNKYFIEIQDGKFVDLKQVYQENEILKEEKEQAWEEWNNLEQGSYETELKLKEENRELKAEMKDGVIAIKLYALQTENEKLKNKIEHYQKLQHNYIEKYDEINEGLQAMISALQELLESEE